MIISIEGGQIGHFFFRLLYYFVKICAIIYKIVVYLERR